MLENKYLKSNICAYENNIINNSIIINTIMKITLLVYEDCKGMKKK